VLKESVNIAEDSLRSDYITLHSSWDTLYYIVGWWCHIFVYRWRHTASSADDVISS